MSFVVERSRSSLQLDRNRYPLQQAERLAGPARPRPVCPVIEVWDLVEDRLALPNTFASRSRPADEKGGNRDGSFPSSAPSNLELRGTSSQGAGQACAPTSCLWAIANSSVA